MIEVQALAPVAPGAPNPRVAERLRRHSLLSAAVVSTVLTACGGAALKPTEETPVAKSKPATPPPVATKRGGGYYLDDGPGDNPPANMESIPDAVPKAEPLRPAANRRYEVFGRTYAPMTSVRPYRERGVASWYGQRYHGKRTSSGETYDMYGMTAAHPTLPIPSYVRVTNLGNRRSVVVRVNDRGPFLHDRVIDLSYTAAYKLGTLGSGSGLVEVVTIVQSPATSTKNDSVLERGGEQTQTEKPLPPVLQGVQGSGGLYLQLGAFSDRENAESFLSRIKNQATDLASSLQVYLRGGLYRVHAGPYATHAAARTAAGQLASRLGVKAVVMLR